MYDRWMGPEGAIGSREKRIVGGRQQIIPNPSGVSAALVGDIVAGASERGADGMRVMELHGHNRQQQQDQENTVEQQAAQTPQDVLGRVFEHQGVTDESSHQDRTGERASEEAE